MQSPGFTLVAALTLALGIGATSAIFSVVNAVLLRPLPFPEPERLVDVAQTWKEKAAVYSPQNFLDVEAQAKSFERLAAIDTNGVTLTGHGDAARLEGAAVSAGFFDVLRVRPVLGRGFVAGENEPGRTDVVVLGHKLWQERFGGDPGIVGQKVQIDREPRTVVGVAPRRLRLPGGRRDLAAARVRQAVPHGQPRRLVPDGDRTARAGRLGRERPRGGVHDRRRGSRGTTRTRTKASAAPCGGCASRWSATRARRSSCCWAPWAWCCWWRASTSRTCCSRGSAGARASSRCARRSEPGAAASCASC